VDMTPWPAAQAIGQSTHMAPDFPDFSLEPDLSLEEVLTELPLDAAGDSEEQPMAAESTPKVA
jgi:hypothetical protein